MTHITIDVLGRNSSLEFVVRLIQAIKSNLVERFRPWREYRTVAAEPSPVFRQRDRRTRHLW